MRSWNTLGTKGRSPFPGFGKVLALLILALVVSGAGCGKEDSASERSAAVIQTKPARLDDIRITVVYDNIPFRPGPIPEWGFSCLVKGGNGPILFDTGGSAQTLEKNLAVLGVDLAPVGVVFISHDHRDHTGGAVAVLADGRRRVLQASCFSFHLILILWQAEGSGNRTPD